MPDIDKTKIKRYPLVITIGSAVLSPLKEAPAFEPEQEFYACLVYDNGGKEPVARFLTKNNEKITLNTLDIDYAMAAVKDAMVGDDIWAEDKAKVLSFTPVLGEGETGKTLVFTNCYLEPSLSYVPSMGDAEHSAKLVFTARPDKTTKKLFTWA